MSLRKFPFVEKEYYHVYNRGVDKRNIICDFHDLDRLLKSMVEFNTINPIGSIYENRERKRGSKASTFEEPQEPLVNFVAFGINSNHFHFILEQVGELGIEKFMHRFGTGFSKFFNIKYERSGALFQGKFQAKLVTSNEYLLHLSAYVNLNDRIHNRGSKASTLSKTSWDEYININYKDPFCKKDIVLGQFKNSEEYRKFAEESLRGMIEKKIMLLEEFDED